MEGREGRHSSKGQAAIAAAGRQVVAESPEVWQSCYSIVIERVEGVVIVDAETQ